ncbi:MAG TPA: cell division protein ZapA [Pyrinomonadaceae bacterium]
MENPKSQPPFNESVEVNIFNRPYSLRSAGGADRVREAAGVVDERMRQVAAQITTHDALKIAVLAALNIADEMEGLKRFYESEIRSLTATEADAPTPAAQGAAPPDKEGADRTWFEDFFDARVATKERKDRLSSRLSARLQNLRQPDAEPLTIEAEEEG